MVNKFVKKKGDDMGLIKHIAGDLFGSIGSKKRASNQESSKPQKNKIERNISEDTRNWIEIKDINNEIIYTPERVLGFIEIIPISFDLKDERNKEEFVDKLARQFDSINFNIFQFSTTTTTNLDKYIEKINQKISVTKSAIKRKILRDKLKRASEISVMGEYVEPIYYIGVSEKNNKQGIIKLKNNIRDIRQIFTSIGVKTIKLDDIQLRDIYQLYFRRKENEFGILENAKNITIQ